MELRYSQYPRTQDRSEQVAQVQRKLNRIGAGRWLHIDEDGLFGAQTRDAVIAYQRYRHISPAGGLGVIDDYTYANLMNERETYISAAPGPVIRSAGPVIKAAPTVSVHKAEHPIIDTTLVVYGTASAPAVTAIGATQNVVDIDKILARWQSVIKQQIDNLRRRASSIPLKKPMRLRNLQHQLDKAYEFVDQSKRYGINVGSKMTEGLSKESIIKYMREIADIFEDCGLLKMLNAAKAIFDKLKRALKPIIDLLKKTPGLKYLSVIDKIIKGTLNLFKCDFEKALALYIDGMRDLAETLLIDAAIAALIAAGGWIALVAGLVLVIGALVLDYFLFNEDSGNTKLKTYNASAYAATKLYGLTQ